MSREIALIVGTNLHWAPFYYRYEKFLKKKNIEFDLILWNREGIKETCSATRVIECNTRDVANNKNPLKIWKFLVFGNFVKKTIKQGGYNKLLFVGTYGCAIAFCCNYLAKNYKNRMWIDIRDDLYEWFKPFYLAEKKSIDASFATTISSPAFIKFLPEHNYFLMHNIDQNAVEMARQFAPITEPEGRIRISFVGNVRYFKQNVRLLEALKNDSRYKIQYFGKGSDELEEYCLNNGINNVEFYGSFKQEDTISFYQKTDIINNMYGNETRNLQLALSNKLYYGLLLKLPILVSDNTLMEELTKEYQIGFSFEKSKEFPDKLFKWYKDIQKGIIKPRYDDLWARVSKEDMNSMRKLDAFLDEREGDF